MPWPDGKRSFARKSTQFRNAKKNIVVEDNDLIASSLVQSLKKRRYKVGNAPDAVSAVERACQTEPDLVLIDISLPGGNGIEVAKQVQESLPKPVRLVFPTASKDPTIKERALTVSTATFFYKPYQPAELLEAVSDLLAGQETSCEKEVRAV